MWSCIGGSNNSGKAAPNLNAQLRQLIREHGLTGDPAKGRLLPSINDPLAQLGMKLFFTKGLGGNMDAACVSCHHPVFGGSDGLSLPIGVDAVDPDLIGPGRLHQAGAHGFDGGPTVPRNSPATFNVALWDSSLFWDSRVESLGKSAGFNGGDGYGIRTPDTPFGEADLMAGTNLAAAQSRFPVTSPEEMRAFTFEAGNDNTAVRDHLVARLGDFGIGAGELPGNTWLNEFQTAFSSSAGAEELITFERVVEAIGAYERSQTFVDNPWKDFVEGDQNAISRSAKRGAILFFKPVEDGGAGCVQCHSGDFFTDEQHYNIAVPQVGRGKGDGGTGTDDFGRFRETGQSEDMYAFRTPSLLNLAVSGPYGHSGAYTSLEAMVRHHLDVETAIANYDTSQLDPTVQTGDWQVNSQAALNDLLQKRVLGIQTVMNCVLNEQEFQDLMAFLDALNDPCVLDRQCLDPWIPDGSVSDPDGQRLNGKDQFGQPL
ncbi:MAG: cytochrome-c peroxidase [Planctomycetota bacterium]|nr:MAG: cytochrome-c peroxidase [Planctomycetota bacterium]